MNFKHVVRDTKTVLVCFFVLIGSGALFAHGTKEVSSRTIVDQTGATVVLPEKIERVVITTLWPLPSVFCLVDGSAERLVGIHP